MKIRKVKDLYKILPKEFRNEYSIGIHGFDGGGRYWERTEDENYQLNQNKIEETKEAIISDGLEFKEGRTLLSTVSFGRLSSYITTKGQYDAGGVIIALPKILRSESGDELFVGSPNEDSIPYEQWDRNKQATSLSEIILPEEGNLSPRFIIGTYTKSDDGIEIELNQKHIAFNKGVVPDKYFQEKQYKLASMIRMAKIAQTVISETEKQQLKYKMTIKQRIARKIATNSFFSKLPFVDKFVKKHVNLLPNTTQQDVRDTSKRKIFINELSNNGEYIDISNNIDLNVIEHNVQEHEEQEQSN